MGWDARVEGQARELNYNTWHMREALSRTGIQLDRHSISTLALTEPRTFRALTAVAALKTQQSPEEGGLGRGIADGTGPNIPVVGGGVVGGVVVFDVDDVIVDVAVDVVVGGGGGGAA